MGRTAAFFLKILPMLPSRPIDHLTKTPIVERVAYPSAAGPVEADLYRPPGPGPHPGIVVCLGVVPFGVEHPQVARLGSALARAGCAALLYWSPAMRDLRLVPDDIEGIARAYAWLVSRPDVDAARSGLLGTCVGGAFALMAAGHPSIREHLGFVIAFAPYSSMWTFVRDIASASTGPDGAREPWAVDQLTRKVYLRSVTDGLERAEADLLLALADGRGGASGPLTDQGRAIHALIASTTADAASRALDALPTEMRLRLDRMSPLAYVNDLRAPVITIAHDKDDHVVPVWESRRLRAALDGRVGVHYTEFAMFEHADPTKRRLPPLRLAGELAKFYGFTAPAFRAMIG